MKILLLAVMLVSGFVAAGEEPPTDQQMNLYLLMRDRNQEIHHYRIDVPEGSSCFEYLKLVVLGPHSRDAKFCASYVEHTGSALLKFKKLDGVDVRD